MNNTWVNPFAIRDVSMCTLVKKRVIQVSVPINDMAKELFQLSPDDFSITI